MHILPVLTAVAIGLAATLGVANAQATNVQKQGGTAPTVGNTADSMSKPVMKASKKMKKAKKAKKSKAKRGAA